MKEIKISPFVSKTFTYKRHHKIFTMVRDGFAFVKRTIYNKAHINPRKSKIKCKLGARDFASLWKKHRIPSRFRNHIIAQKDVLNSVNICKILLSIKDATLEEFINFSYSVMTKSGAYCAKVIYDYTGSKRFLRELTHGRDIQFLYDIWSQIKILQGHGIRVEFRDNIQNYHAALTREVDRIKFSGDIIHHQRTYDFVTSFNEKSYLKLTLPTRQEEVTAWGRSQHHCIGSYANSVGLGHRNFVAEVTGGEKLYHIMFDNNFNIIQFYAAFNEIPCDKDNNEMINKTNEIKQIKILSYS